MSRLMSVTFTADAVIERRKTVTRRKNWWQDKNGKQLLKPGDRLTLCRKVMGRKPGEPLDRLAEVEVVDIRRESLELLGLASVDNWGYAWSEMEKEGFPHMGPGYFVAKYFIEAQGLTHDDEVTRIEWRYLDASEVTP